ncbi:hypothetical protein H8356DRAFT_1362403 [Neocallimastix lanati (nom. inval.)]|nr:hypothetical protein H8356DRAFT_1396014 [Neocallimastix sp. JGI-2020a]KAG4083989.1 hypothetical protein H8356DRAFT_1362403 [Neocallimastix sp. JGI-2020a]
MSLNVLKFDMTKNEFCVTYKGELVLAQSSIKNCETGDCYLSEICINNYVVVDNETDKLKFAPLNNSVMLNVQKIKKIQKNVI